MEGRMQFWALKQTWRDKLSMSQASVRIPYTRAEQKERRRKKTLHSSQA